MASSVEGVLSSGYVAPNTFFMKRDIRKKIFPRYNEQNLFIDFLIHSNRKKEADNTVYSWYEKDLLRNLVEVASKTGTTGAGNAVTVTLTSGSHQESGKFSSLKAKDQVLIYTATGVQQGYVLSVNKTVDSAHTATIKPIDDAVNLVAAVAAADLIGVLSNAKGDGTGMTGSMVNKPVKYENQVQTFSTQYKTNGSESTNKVEFEVQGKPYFYLSGVEDAAISHSLSMEYAFILGQKGTKVDPDNGETVYFTGGMEDTIKNFGNNYGYGASFDLTDLKVVVKKLDRERAPQENLFLAAVNLNIDIDDFVTGKLDNTAVNFAEMGSGSSKLRAVDFGIDTFRYGNYTFRKQKFDPLNYKGLTGLDASPYPDMGFIIPLDKVKNPGKGGDEYMDTISLRYKANDKMNRFEKHWTRDVTITNLDQLEFNHMSEAGIQLACANQMYRLYKS